MRFEKLIFYPKVFQYLAKIATELNYELVMITNQDGLGTSSFPEDNFWPIQNFIVQTFKNEGVEFSEDGYRQNFCQRQCTDKKA